VIVSFVLTPPGTSHLQEVEAAVGVLLQAESPKGEGDEEAGRHRHRPVAVSARWVVARVTG